ncbi:hypothetical protein JTE90_004510 [Oedothorax gibbosus]|uniref:CWH43-like N-terminal domain-containing protein n=1 Tax=Oedothorax gibbosus TaxID=931172 RepID=A0AAV6VCA0_9ARAC|nr:hypothetical protein JTE90_004510 [Oedothorax gibbosus]
MPARDMDGKGNALITTTRTTEWNLNNGGYVSLAFGGLILLGCAVAYVIAVARGNIDAVLPLISDAAGSPPQNGLFGTLVCLGGMFGVMFMIQRYMIVLEKNKEQSRLVATINISSLCVGISSMLGITLVTGYPLNFYRNRDVWLSDVGLPHMIGGLMLLSLGLLYIALQCILTLFLKDKNDTTPSVRILLLFICTSAFVYHMITIPEHFGGVSHLYYLNDTSGINYTGILPYPPTLGASLKLPIDTGGSYMSSAIAQWVFIVFFCCFFFTFFSEAQEYSLQVVIETHITKAPEVADPRLDFRKMSMAQNGGQIGAKPPPEVRKVLRRDSTCQTMTDTLTEIIPSKYKNSLTGINEDKNKKSEKTNGTKKTSSNSEMDAKLTKILNECDSDKNGSKPKVTVSDNGC